MRVILLSTLALGVLTSAALAEQPLALSDSQMDKITAGGPPNVINTPGSPGTVYPGSPEVRLGTIDKPIKNGQPGQGGFIQTPGAGSIVTPGLPSRRF
jgi:hypothetical protein